MSVGAEVIRIAILVYEGVDELDLIAVYEPLAKAAQSTSPRFRIAPALCCSERRVEGANGMVFDSLKDLSDVVAADALVIPGGRGVRALRGRPRVCRIVRDFVSRKAPVYTVCTGALLLGDLGLLQGFRVAVHGKKWDTIKQFGVSSVSGGLVRDRWLRTIGGQQGESYVKGIELAYQILYDFCPAAIEYVAERLEIWPKPRTE